MRPELSVVIPTFRRQRQLKEALASVSGQGNFPFEVIVVDDSPEGSAREVVDSHLDGRVRYFKNLSPSGGAPSKVRNLGLQQCSGDLVHFLDDDDIVPAGHYSRALQEFRDNPRAGILFGSIEPFGEGPPEQLSQEKAFFNEASRRARLSARLGSVWPFVGQMLFGHVLLVCSAAILRRSCAQAVGGFDPGIVLHEDRDFFVRVMRDWGARYMDGVSLRYRIGFPSLMHSANPTPEQLALEREGNRLLKKKYLERHGPVEFYGLKAATKVLNIMT